MIYFGKSLVYYTAIYLFIYLYILLYVLYFNIYIYFYNFSDGKLLYQEHNFSINLPKTRYHAHK